MSDSMAFLAGSAFAGIAALVFLKGGVSLGESNLPAPRPLSAETEESALSRPLMAQAPSSSDLSTLSADLERQVKTQLDQQQLDTERLLERQKTDTERLKDQLDQQQTETERLKAQVRDQQMVIDTLTSKARADVLAAQVNPALSPQAQQVQRLESANGSTVPGIFWALGGMVLTISGGAILAGVLSSFSQQQRSSRTMQVIHSINTPPSSPSLPPRRRSELLPPRLERRADMRADLVDQHHQER